MKKLLPLSLCLFGLALLAPSRPHAQAEKPIHKRGRALLVGINRYQNFPTRPTPGSEEDAQATSDFLIERFGFQRDEIQLLTGDKATAQNIVAEFRRWLIDGTKPGDRVFFLYSGHGTRVRDDGDDEADGEDEALAPYDVTPNLGNLIRDDVFNDLIGELQGRMTVMVFDSCHSGTISRDVPGATPKQNKPEDQPKYLPLTGTQKATRAIGGNNRDDLQVGLLSEKEAKGRDLHLVVDRKKVTQGGVIIFTAAQANQRAFPIKFDSGEFRGALSFVFNETQRQDLPTLRELKDRITREIAALKADKRLNPEPVPTFEVFGPPGLEDQPLFGAAQAAQVLTLGNPNSTIHLTLKLEQPKQRFKIGDPISYRVTSDTEGFLYLLVFSENNVATCLLPNPHLAQGKDNALRGALRIPRAAGELFKAQEPLGKDIVIALLSKTPLALGEKEDYSWDEVFERLRNQQLFKFVKNREAAPIAQRGVGTKKAASPAEAPTESGDWQAVSLTVETIK
ncbi:MAG: DUF4384 domain-containing protein [Acidobacteria bacterium]|nr:DUF4384 domain-containing protein [Acidobacteriota bacterium]